MKSSKHCLKCNKPIEKERPKWAKYCKECGRHRSRDWKREHPERAKLYDSEHAVRDWRDRNNWNAYIKAWREEHHATYRAQNTRHVQEHRDRNKSSIAAALNRRQIVTVAGLLLFVLAAQGCESIPQLRVSIEELDHFDWFLVRLTATSTLLAACLRLILHDVTRLISDTRRRKLESDTEGLSHRRRH